MIKTRIKQFIRQIVLEAIEESNRPFVDPIQEENERLFREMSRRIHEDNESRIKEQREFCPHIAGCNALSDKRDAYNRTSIIWHTFSWGEKPVGICTNCQREFHPSDSDYERWRNLPSINLASSGGFPVLTSSNEDASFSDSRAFSMWDSPEPTYCDDSPDPNLWSPSKLDEAIKNEIKTEYIKAGIRKAELV